MRTHKAARLVLGAAFVLSGVTLVGPLAAHGAARRAEPATGVFGTRTGAVLVFDDGYDGVALVDLDRGRVVRRVLDGQRAGDQPHRLTRAGDAFVVGWSPVSAAPLSGGRSRLLGRATISIPAAERGAVWLDDSGVRLGDRTPRYTLVDTHGRVIVDAGAADLPQIADAQSFPAVGVRGGLAFESKAGVRVWYPTTDRVVLLGNKPAFAGDAHGRTLTWCEDPCTTLHVTRLGGRDRVVAAPAGLHFDVRNARFSPDGTRVAVGASADSHGSLVLVEVRPGATSVVARDVGQYAPAVGWSADGHQLFFSTRSYMAPATDIGRFDLRSGRLQWVTLPFGGALGFVTLTRDEARPLLEAASTLPDSCPAPAIQPSSRGAACGFTFTAKTTATAQVQVPGPDGRRTLR